MMHRAIRVALLTMNILVACMNYSLGRISWMCINIVLATIFGVLIIVLED